MSRCSRTAALVASIALAVLAPVASAQVETDREARCVLLDDDYFGWSHSVLFDIDEPIPTIVRLDTEPWVREYPPEQPEGRFRVAFFAPPGLERYVEDEQQLSWWSEPAPDRLSLAIDKIATSHHFRWRVEPDSSLVGQRFFVSDLPLGRSDDIPTTATWVPCPDDESTGLAGGILTVG